jgi:hypothetical protein
MSKIKFLDELNEIDVKSIESFKILINDNLVYPVYNYDLIPILLIEITKIKLNYDLDMLNIQVNQVKEHLKALE